MKRFVALTAMVGLVSLGALGAAPAGATIWFSDGFETNWSGDYAPGWENTAYRHGAAPTGKMMQQTDNAKFGTNGLRLIADAVPENWMWWAAVNPKDEKVPHWAMARQYNPYVSVWYYDAYDVEGIRAAGQLFAVPDWVNPYLTGGEDWTDVQFGARTAEVAANYYYVAAGQSSPGWQDTTNARSAAWHNLKFQLLASDGRIHFYLDGSEVGQSYRNDYTNLGQEVGLYTMFTDPLSGWTDKPYTEWDDFEVGSDAVPEPTTVLLLGSGLLGLAGLRRKKST